ncbi:MAG: carboxypeptidase-like regulatory domain-containing protein, partial [Salinivirgaceae bacterium]|nr:carboxypeptidase-like regulatory domain-containing protein [Salinivirgaceae bacterium]
MKSVLRYFSVALCLLLSVSGYAQQKKSITGRVVDNTNKSIVGATISFTLSGELLGGTSTDLDGNFNFSAPVGSTLKVSFVGYKPYQETVTEAKSNYEIILAEELQSLDEVVVVGYGTQKR